MKENTSMKRVNTKTEGKTMRSAVVPRPGGPDVFEIQDVTLAPLTPGYARVRLEYSAVNSADIWTRHPGVVSAYPHIPGSDGCGTLVEVNGRAAVDLGSRVVVNPALQPLTGNRSWSDPFKDIVQILGYNCAGTYAEYCDVPIENVYPAPAHLTSEQAAAIPLTYLTAWRMLVRRGAVQSGENLLVWGASGGLGCAAIVLAKYLGANVLATAGSDRDADDLSKLDITGVVRYDRENIPSQIEKIVGGKVDLIFDSVAGDTWPASLKSLRPGGRIVLAGTTAGDVVTHDLSEFFYNQWTLLGCRMGDEHDFAAMLKAVEEGQLKPVISTTFPLSRVADAHEAMEGSQHVGKIVLKNTE